MQFCFGLVLFKKKKKKKKKKKSDIFAIPTAWFPHAKAHFSTSEQLIILEDDKYKVKCCGTIGEWWIWVRFSAKIAFQVWTLNDGTGKYVLKGKNERVLTNGT